VSRELPYLPGLKHWECLFLPTKQDSDVLIVKVQQNKATERGNSLRESLTLVLLLIALKLDYKLISRRKHIHVQKMFRTNSSAKYQYANINTHILIHAQLTTQNTTVTRHVLSELCMNLLSSLEPNSTCLICYSSCWRHYNLLCSKLHKLYNKSNQWSLGYMELTYFLHTWYSMRIPRLHYVVDSQLGELYT